MPDQALCAICQTEARPEEARVACPACNAVYHEECWNENGGCAIYGCSQVPAVEQRRSIEIPVSYWGQENKPCPSCGREILAAAVRCRYCGATFASAQPQGADEFREKIELESRLPRVRKTVVWLFIFSVLPCTAPIGGLANLIWYANRHREVAALPSIYSALSKIGIGVGLGQTVLLVLMGIIYSVTRGGG